MLPSGPTGNSRLIYHQSEPWGRYSGSWPFGRTHGARDSREDGATRSECILGCGWCSWVAGNDIIMILDYRRAKVGLSSLSMTFHVATGCFYIHALPFQVLRPPYLEFACAAALQGFDLQAWQGSCSWCFASPHHDVSTCRAQNTHKHAFVLDFIRITV
jgi:hypothetical protein